MIRDPFDHLVLDDFLPTALADACALEFPTTHRGFIQRWHLHSRKWTCDQYSAFPPALRDASRRLMAPQMLTRWATTFDISGLVADPHFFGGGLHRTEYRGFLDIHADFTRHPTTRFQRVLNLLWFLNPDWHQGDGGELELWNATATQRVCTIAPLHNRAVIFRTSATSFHGHPEPFRGLTRRSVALYYYRPPQPGDPYLRTTQYVPRSHEWVKRTRKAVGRMLDRAHLR